MTGFWMVLVVLGVLFLFLLTYIIIIYNGLVALRHSVASAWANIDVLLRQRHDEIPKLVDVCKAYMKHERETLVQVMQARQKAFEAGVSKNIEEVGESETHIRQILSHLFAVVERYPELKADQQFLKLQKRITALENQIADRREFYNESVKNNNIRVEMFPDKVIADFFKFEVKEFLEFTSLMSK